jgi:hypothetical protein
MVTIELPREGYITLGILAVLGLITFIGLISALIYYSARIIIKRLDLIIIPSSKPSPKQSCTKNNQVKPPEDINKAII